MALTREDLQGIRQLLQPLQEAQSAMQADIAGVKTELSGVKADIAGVKTELSGVKADIDLKGNGVLTGLTEISEIKTDIRAINRCVAVIEVDHGEKLSALYDAQVNTMRNADAVQELSTRVDDHGHRIFALELALKK